MEVPAPPQGAPARTIVHGDAFAWLAANAASPGTSVVTSLPDVSELPALGLDGWRAWFRDAARTLLRWIPDDGVAIFFQSDVRADGVWIDKGYLVQRAAEDEAASLVWHKIVCRHPAGTITIGRPSWSHMLCFARAPRPLPTRPGPDVLPAAGAMPWKRAMGVEACRVACRFLREETTTRLVVDPFCGHGTALAVANAMGFDALGVDRSARCVRAAQALVID